MSELWLKSTSLGGWTAGRPAERVLEELELKPTQPPTVVGLGLGLSLAINILSVIKIERTKIMVLIVPLMHDARPRNLSKQPGWLSIYLFLARPNDNQSMFVFAFISLCAIICNLNVHLITQCK